MIIALLNVKLNRLCVLDILVLMHKLRDEAEKLRDQGYSYALINQKLGISKGTLSYWFKDKPFTPNEEVNDRIKSGPLKVGIKSHNRRVKEINELKDTGAQEVGKLTKRDLWMLGLGLYIGEGSKTVETIRIINSDPKVIATSIRWLKEVCGLANENITIALHIYPDNNEAECKKYWQKVTGLPENNFRKTQVDRRINKKHTKRGKLPYGTAHLTVISNGDPNKGVRLYRKVNGWITGALQQI